MGNAPRRDFRERPFEKLWRLLKNSAVMAALDAAIHEKHQTFNMLRDGWVNPGDDNGRPRYFINSRESGTPSPCTINLSGLDVVRRGPRMRGDDGGMRHGFSYSALVIGLLLALCPGPALAVDPQEQLKDPALEARAREISAGLRCLVCQNQSIDDSDAPLARDLRLIVRQQLQKGESDSQVVDYIVARYGEFVLLRPRLRLNTLILWLTPLLLLAGGGVLAARIVRRQPQTRLVPPLNPEEQKELQSLLAPPGPGKS
jgi:cytochrome c-type biogenesis protein CcmH